MTGAVADWGTKRSAGYVSLTCERQHQKSQFRWAHGAVAQPFWPGCTRLVLLIDRREFPQGVGESHSVVISDDVQEGPFVSPLPLVSVGVIGETVQLLVPLCKADSKARRRQETHHQPAAAKTPPDLLTCRKPA